MAAGQPSPLNLHPHPHPNLNPSPSPNPNPNPNPNPTPHQVNPHIEADTTQLDKLKGHGSGTRAAASKNARAAGEKARAVLP